MAKKEHMNKKTDQELSTLLSEVRAKLRGERFAAAGSRPADSDNPKKLRREVARILTERRSRALAS